MPRNAGFMLAPFSNRPQSVPKVSPFPSGMGLRGMTARMPGSIKALYKWTNMLCCVPVLSAVAGFKGQPRKLCAGKGSPTEAHCQMVVSLKPKTKHSNLFYHHDTKGKGCERMNVRGCTPSVVYSAKGGVSQQIEVQPIPPKVGPLGFGVVNPTNSP